MLSNMSGSYRDIALENDVRRLADLVRYAQLYARSNRCICRLTIDTERNEYYVGYGIT